MRQHSCLRPLECMRTVQEPGWVWAGPLGMLRRLNFLGAQCAPSCLLTSLQALPLPPRGSGFDPSNPEEVELWRLQQGLAREREYHQLAKRKAGEVMST